MSKAIPTTSLAKKGKTEKQKLRRSVLDHGNTDSDAIEDKRQHSAAQLIRLGQTVNKLNQTRVLIEDQGEKKIAELRESAKGNRKAWIERNPNGSQEQLAELDRRAEAAIENESLALSILLHDHEQRTAALSAQILQIDALNLIVDCLSIRERVEEEEGGKKVLVRDSIAAMINDVAMEVTEMKATFLTLTEEIKKSNQENQATVTQNSPTINKPIPKLNGVKG